MNLDLRHADKSNAIYLLDVFLRASFDRLSLPLGSSLLDGSERFTLLCFGTLWTGLCNQGFHHNLDSAAVVGWNLSVHTMHFVGGFQIRCRVA